MHMPGIFQQREVEAAGLSAGVQPGLHGPGKWLGDKGLAKGGQGAVCELGEGKEGLQYSGFPKAGRSILIERAVNLVHSCRKVKSGDHKGRVSGSVTIVVKGTLATECHVLQLLPGTKEGKGLWGAGRGGHDTVILCTCRS